MRPSSVVHSCLVILVFAMGGAGAVGAEDPAIPAEEPTKEAQVEQVRSWIATMLDQPLSQEAVALHDEVVDFAKHSDDVFISVSPKFFQFTDSPYDSLLMAHYIAGATLFDLDHPDQAKDELADVPSALDATAKLYRQIRAKDATFQRPFFDTVEAQAQKGELQALVQELNAAPAPEPSAAAPQAP